VAPVFVIRASASVLVSHVVLCPKNNISKKDAGLVEYGGAYLVPGLFTRGSATHCCVAAQGVSWNLPLTHCANWSSTHADSPDVHGESAVRFRNFWLSACASFPFCSVNAAR